MRTLAVIEFITLDGVMQGLGSPDEDRDGGFRHGGWGAPYGDQVLGEKAREGSAGTSAYLLGRRTYEKMAAYWPHQSSDDPIAAHLNSTPKHVVTSTLETFEWEGAQALRGELPGAVRELKEEGEGTIAVLGSGVLVQALIEHDLVDAYRLFVHPLVLGTGKRLFRETPAPIPMRLTGCETTSTGVLLLAYEPERG